jgi:hypothetical protein
MTATRDVDLRQHVGRHAGSGDMRSRARFELLFVISHRHVAYCREQVRQLRAQNASAVASTH